MLWIFILHMFVHSVFYWLFWFYFQNSVVLFKHRDNRYFISMICVCSFRYSRKSVSGILICGVHLEQLGWQTNDASAAWKTTRVLMKISLLVEEARRTQVMQPVSMVCFTLALETKDLHLKIPRNPVHNPANPSSHLSVMLHFSYFHMFSKMEKHIKKKNVLRFESSKYWS